MKKISTKLIAELVNAKRKEQKITQEQLSKMTGINRSMIGRIENEEYIPAIDQLQALAEALGFEITDVIVDDAPAAERTEEHVSVARKYNIAIAGTGYVGLSLAVLLSQHNHLTPVKTTPKKLDRSTLKNLPFRMITLKNILQKKNWTSRLLLTEKAHIKMRISLSLPHPLTTTAGKTSSTAPL